MLARALRYIMVATLCPVIFMSNLAISQTIPVATPIQKPGAVQGQPAVDPPPPAPIPAVITQLQASHNTCPPPCADWKAPEPWFVYVLLMIVLFGILFSIGAVKVALDKHKTWSLADALSEETEATAAGTTLVAGGAAGAPPVQPATSPLVTTSLASSSRLIAFLGSIVILFLFLGFGLVALYDFATMGTLPPSTSSVKDYLLTGLALFAPYAVNKFSSLFEGLTPKKP